MCDCKQIGLRSLAEMGEKCTNAEKLNNAYVNINYSYRTERSSCSVFEFGESDSAGWDDAEMCRTEDEYMSWMTREPLAAVKGAMTSSFETRRRRIPDNSFILLSKSICCQK